MAPGLRQPFDEESDEEEDGGDESEEPDGPTTPPDDPAGPTTPPPTHPAPDGPSTPPDTPQPAPMPTRAGARSRGARSAPDARIISWRPWWGYNREDLLDLRTLERKGPTLTGARASGPKDPLGALRAETLETLRHVALSSGEDPVVRTQALLAIGRAAAGIELAELVALVRNRSENDRVREAAMLAVGLFPAVESQEARGAIRRTLEWSIFAADVPQQLREFGLIATGLRAQHEEGIELLLALRCDGGLVNWDEGAALALALGLSGKSLLLPEMLGVATRGELCGAKLHDAGRSHGIVALGRTDSPAVLPALVRVLQSRRTGADSRRSAALAIGRILREGSRDAADAGSAARELARQIEHARDPVLRGYCAVALGAARPPQELQRLSEALTDGSDAILRGYAAIGIGLAARELQAAEAKPLRALLVTELARTRDPEQASALMVGAGLAGAHECVPDLIDRLERKGSSEDFQESAAEALGLMGVPSAPVMQALREALLRGGPHVGPAAAEALALLGDSSSALQVLDRLDPGAHAHLHTHLCRAVAFAGDPAAAPVLLELLRDERAGDSARADAAMALGILGNLRQRDGLSGLAAWFNLDSTTMVTRAIVVASCGCRGATVE